MAINIDTLKSLAQTIHDATATGENTAERVGNAFLECANDIAQANTADEVTQALNTLQTSITANANAISSANSNISSLQSSVNTANNNISSLQSSVSTANNNITSLQSGLATANSNITSLQQQIAGLSGSGGFFGLPFEGHVSGSLDIRHSSCGQSYYKIVMYNYSYFLAVETSPEGDRYYTQWDEQESASGGVTFPASTAYQTEDESGNITPNQSSLFANNNELWFWWKSDSSYTNIVNALNSIQS